jgi:hypothetical protein
MDYGEGTILIEDVIWGGVAAGETLRLIWKNESNILCPRLEHRQNAGKKAIWLLTVRGDHEVSANHPSRFVAIEQRDNVEKALRKNPVCLRTDDPFVRATQPVRVSLVFRNPTDQPREFPGIDVRGDHVMVTTHVNFALYCHSYATTPNSTHDMAKSYVEPLKNLAVLSASTCCVLPIVVAPGQEQRITLDLKTLFPFFQGDDYSFEFKVKGHRRANTVQFYSRREADHKEDFEQQPGVSKPKDVDPGNGLSLYMLPGLTVSGALAVAHRRRT